MGYMFSNCSSLNDWNLSNFNTINVNNIKGMFSECSSLTSLNISNFHINNNTNIENLFYKLNKKCKIICKDKIILNKYKMNFIFE